MFPLNDRSYCLQEYWSFLLKHIFIYLSICLSVCQSVYNFSFFHPYNYPSFNWSSTSSLLVRQSTNISRHSANPSSWTLHSFNLHWIWPCRWMPSHAPKCWSGGWDANGSVVLYLLYRNLCTALYCFGNHDAAFILQNSSVVPIPFRWNHRLNHQSELPITLLLSPLNVVSLVRSTETQDFQTRIPLIDTQCT